MVGVDQCGLAHTIEYILQSCPPDIQHRLVQNFHVTGGNTLFPNFTGARLKAELMAMRPYIPVLLHSHLSRRQAARQVEGHSQVGGGSGESGRLPLLRGVPGAGRRVPPRALRFQSLVTPQEVA